MLERQAVDDGRQVAAQAGGEAAQFGQVVGFGCFQPCGQFVASTDAAGSVCRVKDVGLGDGSTAPVSFEAGAAGWL